MNSPDQVPSSVGDPSSPSTNQDEIDRVLRLKRLSQVKSCYPCRQRKVKCDHGLPCRTCQRRGHPEICTYGIDAPDSRRTQRSRRSAADARSSETRNRAARRSQSPERHGSQPLRTPQRTPHKAAEVIALTHSDDAPLPSGDQAPRNKVYEGGSSLLAMLRGPAEEPSGEMRRNAGPVLGLQNTLDIYPFMKPQSPQEQWAALLQIIPQQQEILRFFPSYGTITYPLSPLLADINDLEADLCKYLEALESGELRDPHNVSEKWIRKDSIARISLVLAALASGVHYSLMQPPRKRAEFRQDFIQRSFDALRLSNFTMYPSVDSVQALLVVGNVLQDCGQSDGAWVLLGTTIRMAQARGLHTQSIAQQPRDMGTTRSRALWDILTRQDCLLSMCHGRPPIVSKRYLVDLDPSRQPGPELAMADVMRGITSISLDYMNLDRHSDWGQSLRLLSELDDYYSHALPHLRSREKCANLQQHHENLTIRIYTSFTASVLCRGAITRSTPSPEQSDFELLKGRAKESLKATSRAFLEFQAISIIPIRTWALIHAVLSSTILLCMWEVTRNDPESRELQQRVVEAFSRAAQADDETGVMADPSSADSNPWLSTGHVRALVALQKVIQMARPLDAQRPSSAPLPPQFETAMQQQQPGEPTHNAEYTASGESGVGRDLDFNFTSMLGDGFGLEPNDFSWDSADLSPLMYLDSIMNASYDRNNQPAPSSDNDIFTLN